MMKILKRVLIFGIILALLILSFLYWGSYEKGEMAGKVLRISEKGFVFKTHEGKLSLESFGALRAECAKAQAARASGHAPPIRRPVDAP